MEIFLCVVISLFLSPVHTEECVEGGLVTINCFHTGSPKPSTLRPRPAVKTTAPNVHTTSLNLPMSTNLLPTHLLVIVAVGMVAVCLVVAYPCYGHACSTRPVSPGIQSAGRASAHTENTGKVRPDYENDPAANAVAFDHKNNAVFLGLHPQNTNQDYQNLNPQTINQNSLYQSLHNQTTNQDSTYQSLNPQTINQNSLYQSLHPPN